MAQTIRKTRNGQRVAIDATLTLTTCWCGINVGVPSNLYRMARESGTEVYCPLGHRFYFTQTELEEVKQLLEEEKRRRRMAQDRAERNLQAAEAAERRRIAQKGATTRIANRVKRGVCPCCTRHFSNLEAHMATEHPDYRAPVL